MNTIYKTGDLYRAAYLATRIELLGTELHGDQTFFLFDDAPARAAPPGQCARHREPPSP